MPVLLIKREPHFKLDEVEIPQSFKSRDYMEGFLDGYLFKKYKLITQEELEDRINSMSPSLSEYYVRFLSIVPEE